MDFTTTIFHGQAFLYIDWNGHWHSFQHKYPSDSHIKQNYFPTFTLHQLIRYVYGIITFALHYLDY